MDTYVKMFNEIDEKYDTTFLNRFENVLLMRAERNKWTREQTYLQLYECFDRTLDPKKYNPYSSKNYTKYPADAKRAGVQGKVVVSFVINQDGTTCDHRIVKSHFSSMDREVLRVLKLMPNWKPGEDKGKPCRTMFVIPVVFML